MIAFRKETTQISRETNWRDASTRLPYDGRTRTPSVAVGAALSRLDGRQTDEPTRRLTVDWTAVPVRRPQLCRLPYPFLSHKSSPSLYFAVLLLILYTFIRWLSAASYQLHSLLLFLLLNVLWAALLRLTNELVEDRKNAQWSVTHTKPYRNMWIVDAVRTSFFSGGNLSFATRYKYLFPSSETHDLVTVYEVPIPMLALVATALYAALYKWQTGEQQIAEFSTNSYLDIYQGHVNTLELIQEKRSSVFRSMMADIYRQASTVTNTGVYLGAPVADLDIDDLKE
ncbi:hypothetical protein EDB84DRAFT_1445388 [Lactarius hengduanensis]|nr:hypothetical protein EDB84DRAFT_1445388 [Lactarius hengduanensis]